MQISAFDHVGIRVRDEASAVAFYGRLGFEVVYREPAPGGVVVVRNASGVELNFIINAAADFDGNNVLLDVPVKRPGYTHIALSVPSIEQAQTELAELGIEITEGPVRLGEGTSLFFRDPDRNVIELRES